MHEVLVNRLGGLSLSRKSVVRLTDRPDMTLDVNRGRKTTMQQQQQQQNLKSLYSNKWSLGCYAIKNVSLKAYVSHFEPIRCCDDIYVAYNSSSKVSFLI